jgi:broad-specificity NMP kinase
MVLNCGVTIALSIGSRLILRQNEKLTKQYNNMREVGMSLAKMSAYQNAFIQKHVDMSVLDEFDQMVITDMNQELVERLKQIGYTPEEENHEHQ